MGQASDKNKRVIYTMIGSVLLALVILAAGVLLRLPEKPLAAPSSNSEDGALWPTETIPAYPGLQNQPSLDAQETTPPYLAPEHEPFSQALGTQYPYPAPETQPISSAAYRKFTGPTCLVDTFAGLAVRLPIGWYGDGGPNGIEITNYDPDKLKFQHGAALNMPADHVKIELYVFEIDPGISMDQYITAEKFHVLQGDDINPSITWSKNSPIKLGKYEGVTYIITVDGDWSSQGISIRVSDKKAITFNISPTDSPALKEAVAILNHLDASDHPKCISLFHWWR